MNDPSAPERNVDFATEGAINVNSVQLADGAI